MPISVTALKPGQEVFAVTREKMGNTTAMRTVVRSVWIKEVEASAGRVTASWNGNAPRVFHARNGKLPWSRTNPEKPRLPPVLPEAGHA